MKKVVFIFFFTTLFSCTSKPVENQNDSDSTEVVNTNIEDLLISSKESYSISFDINKTPNSTANLYVFVTLNDSIYFMSPTSKLSTNDLFSIELNKNKFIKVDSLIDELPPSVSEKDSSFYQQVFWVEESTTFIWQLSVQTDENFEVSGKIQFRIQPQSNKESIDFIVSQESKELNIFRVGYENKVPTKIMDIRNGATVKGYSP